MGLFDFFKRKATEKPKSTPENENDPSKSELSEDTIQHEIKLNVREVTRDPQLIKEVAEKIIAEDPFVNSFERKPSVTLGNGAKRVYEYTNVTTMEVSFPSGAGSGLQLMIEGILVGNVPEEKARDIQQYQSSNILTAYVYVNGGPYTDYFQESSTVEKGEAPYDLDVYVQFT